jgi:hypothetical protein
MTQTLPSLGPRGSTQFCPKIPLKWVTQDDFSSSRGRCRGR